MRYSKYKFKFYLNASHAIYINGSMGERHPHTWEITLYVLKEREEFVQFSNLEEKINEWMKKYQDKFINQIAPFDTINPTIENCCDFFKENLKIILQNEGWILLSIEISETPTRSYIVNLLEEDGGTSLDNSSNNIADNILNRILGNR
ncbi:MAG: 6-pyruvoyl tetrahydrobiopterin synthase [Anaerolineaceae bacterium]|nr:MAG: 6-pyruvoyl tetrahydrobiopterin synthase [Anaerolineaceae bacterium]